LTTAFATSRRLFLRTFDDLANDRFLSLAVSPALHVEFRQAANLDLNGINPAMVLTTR
jgi:hypothetical protein